MNPGALDLLRRLGSGVVPAGRDEPTEAIESQEFTKLLEFVRAPGRSESKPVRIGATGDVELTSEALAEISRLVDAGEAEGVRRLVIVREDHALGIDVEGRVIESADDALTGRVLRSYDGVIIADDRFGRAEEGVAPRLGSLIRNADVTEILARRSREQDGEDSAGGAGAMGSIH